MFWRTVEELANDTANIHITMLLPKSLVLGLVGKDSVGGADSLRNYLSDNEGLGTCPAGFFERKCLYDFMNLKPVDKRVTMEVTLGPELSLTTIRYHIDSIPTYKFYYVDTSKEIKDNGAYLYRTMTHSNAQEKNNVLLAENNPNRWMYCRSR